MRGLTNKQVNAAAKKANRRIRNLEAKGLTNTPAYLSLWYDEVKGRAERFNETKRYDNPAEMRKAYNEIMEFLNAKDSLIKGARMAAKNEYDEIPDRVINAVNDHRAAEGSDRVLPLLTNDSDRRNFVNFLHSMMYKALTHMAASDEVIDIYLKSQEKVSQDEIYKQYKLFTAKEITADEVSRRLTGENVFLL